MTRAAPGIARRRARAGCGFTLLELLVVFAVLGALVVLGLPEFTRWLHNSQVRTAAESIVNGLQLARAEAVRRNVKVRFRLTSTDTALQARFRETAQGFPGTEIRDCQP